MRNPTLGHDLFVRDRILSGEILLNALDFARVQGAVRDGDRTTFTAYHRLTITIPSPLTDLSRFDLLSLRVMNCVEASLLVRMTLYRHSCLESGDRCSSFNGGRERLFPGQFQSLMFPRESFGTYGLSTDWTDLDTLELSFGFDRAYQGPSEVTVAVMALEGHSREIAQGPRLTRRGLGHVLRRDYQRDAAYPRAISQGDRPVCHSSIHEFPASVSGLRVPPPHPYPRETAEEILAGRIMGQEVHAPISWSANPLGVQEWTHFLNRHHFMRTLLIAFIQTQDTRHVVALDQHVAHWVTENPVPVDSDGGAGPPWETLSAAWRLREWIWLRRFVWACDAFSQATREGMLRSVWEHARHLTDHQGHPNNWIMVESCALTLAGMWFPEFREADLWVRTGVQRLTRAFRRQFLADGIHFEMSPLYHAICTHAMLEVKQSAQERNRVLPGAFNRPLERCVTSLSALCRPDFTWPSFNDAGSTDADYTDLMLMAGHIFNRPDLLWFGTRGQVGTAPGRMFHVFPDAGIAAMRSGYNADAHSLVFRAGAPGAAHVHNDVLGLDVTAFGIPRLLDPGVTGYAPDRLTDYYRSPWAHNMVLVDGQGPDRSSMPFHERIAPAGETFSWHSGDGFHAACGLCRGPWRGIMGTITVRRTVIFVRSEYWIVQDMVLGDRKREIVTCWQFSPARVECHAASLGTRVRDARGPQFELLPVPGTNEWNLDLFAGSFAPVAGWTSMGSRDVPSCTVRYCTNCSLPFVQEWLLVPFRGRPLSGVHVARSQDPKGTVLLCVSFPDGKTDTVSVGPLPGSEGGTHSLTAIRVHRSRRLGLPTVVSQGRNKAVP